MDHDPFPRPPALRRRDFIHRAGLGVAGGLVLGSPRLLLGEEAPREPETNLAEFLAVPRTRTSLPGPFPGRVVEVHHPRALRDGKVNAGAVRAMLAAGLTALTGRSPATSFPLFFSRDDIVGIKVNPVGAPLINTRLELVDAVIRWLESCGLPRDNIVIFDRFATGLAEAGYNAVRFPGVRIEGMQIMDEEGGGFRDAQGAHVSAANFDRDVYYFAKGIEGKGVKGYKDDEFYLNQHVFNGEYSYFGRLVTQRLTKIINLAVFKNAGPGISMATKNIGYGVLANTGRLHGPLGFRVNTHVLAAPAVRDKLVLNVLDGLRGQYDGGPMANEQFMWEHRRLYLATDPFALDAACQQIMAAKRRDMGIATVDHPRYTDYLLEGERLGLGVGDPRKISFLRVEA